MLRLIQILLAISLVLCLVLAPVWSDGGVGEGEDGNGWGNLPGGHQVGNGVTGLEQGGPRLTLEFADLRLGVPLRLAPEMSGAIAVVRWQGGAVLPIAAHGRDLVLDGGTLSDLFAVGVRSLDLRIVSLHGWYLPVQVRLAEDHRVTVIVF